LSGWLRFDGESKRLALRLPVRPGARATTVTGPHGGSLKIHVAAPPVDDRANEALLAWIAAALELPRSAVRLHTGAKSRRKIVEVSSADAGVAARAAALAEGT